MSREAHVRICEGLGVRLPRATRLFTKPCRLVTTLKLPYLNPDPILLNKRNCFSPYQTVYGCAQFILHPVQFLKGTFQRIQTVRGVNRPVQGTDAGTGCDDINLDTCLFQRLDYTDMRLAPR